MFVYVRLDPKTALSQHAPVLMFEVIIAPLVVATHPIGTW
jgi:hypothetical protein